MPPLLSRGEKVALTQLVAAGEDPTELGSSRRAVEPDATRV